MKKLSLVIAAVICASMPVMALADYAYKDALNVTQTVLTWACVTSKICPAFVMTDTSGNAFGTTSNPVSVQTQDTRPATGNITVIDSASTTVTTGQNSSTIITGTPTASSAVSQTLNGTSNVNIQVSGTWTGTIETDWTIDNTNWYTLGCHVNGSQTQPTSVSKVTANALLNCPAAGAFAVRARAIAAMTGTAVVTMTATVDTGEVKVTNSPLVGAMQQTVTAGNAQNAAVANGNGTAINIVGYGAALVDVNCSVNCSGGTQVVFEATDITGAYLSVGAIPIGGQSQAVTSVTNQSGQAAFCVPNLGYTSLRSRIAAYSAGTISVTITPINSSGCSYEQVANASTPGRNTSANASPVVPPAAPTTWHLIAANSTNATSVKGSAATLFSCQLANNGTTIGYLKIYNKASSPTVGTDTPVKTLIIPGPAAGGGGSNIYFGPGGLALGTGFAAAVTGVITDADTTAVAATQFAINCDYE